MIKRSQGEMRRILRSRIPSSSWKWKSSVYATVLPHLSLSRIKPNKSIMPHCLFLSTTREIIWGREFRVSCYDATFVLFTTKQYSTTSTFDTEKSLGRKTISRWLLHTCNYSKITLRLNCNEINSCDYLQVEKVVGDSLIDTFYIIAWQG